jgi:YggT family protein
MVSAAIYYTVYGTLWVLFWPLRAWMKKNRPDDYAASQQK